MVWISIFSQLHNTNLIRSCNHRKLKFIIQTNKVDEMKSYDLYTQWNSRREEQRNSGAVEQWNSEIEEQWDSGTVEHSLPYMISAISGTIVHATEAMLGYKPRSIPRVNWDHRNWVHQSGVGWVYHGWVGIVR